MIRLRVWLLLIWAALPSHAQTSLRLATYNVGLDRDGPGLLLKDILKQDPEVLAVAEIIGHIRPDILLLTSFDNDFQNVAISRFASLLDTETGLVYPYIFAPLGNAGLASALDLNANGYLGDWADNWGFGRFEGNKSMVLLSRFPITRSRRFDQLLWQSFGPAPQNPDGSAFYSADIWPRLRLAAHSLWDVEIALPNGPFHVLASHPTPPVFDGDEDANGLRNEAEISFLHRYLDGEALADDRGTTAPLAAAPFVILADLNADPFDGDSRKSALKVLLSHSRLQDPSPQSAGARAAATPGHSGPAALDTVDWTDAASGNFRVDYVLPAATLTVLDAGVYWPVDAATTATSHRLVWVDIATP